MRLTRMSQRISERYQTYAIVRRDSRRAGCIETVLVRFGGESLVFLGNQDPASYPTGAANSASAFLLLEQSVSVRQSANDPVGQRL